MGRRKGLGARRGNLKRFSTGRVEFVTGGRGTGPPEAPKRALGKGEGRGKGSRGRQGKESWSMQGKGKGKGQ